MNRRTVILVTALFVLAAAPFVQTRHFQFLTFDDDVYVGKNRMVQQGLSGESVIRTLSIPVGGNWHPLTVWSHMLDCDLYRQPDDTQWAGGHHLTNVFWHACNTVLLFWVLGLLTGAFWRPALVAALFAVHPQHVESVAWIAERKDVLSTFFGFMAIGAYVWYVRSPSVIRYLTIAAMFGLSLMAKPMWVTLPFVLLLLDIWPLRRLRVAGIGGAESSMPHVVQSTLRRLIAEKVPLLFLSIASSVVTLSVQSAAGAMAADTLLLRYRIANAVVAYASYLQKLVWPTGLTVYYPHPFEWETLRVVISALVLLSIMVCVLVYRNKPWLFVGWALFLGMLVPVIGLVQVGGQYMADRYMYVPATGIFIMVIWSLPTRGVGRAVASIAALVILAVLTVACYIQTTHWKDTNTVFTRNLALTNENAMAITELGEWRLAEGDIDGAIEQLRDAIRIAPHYAGAHESLGIAELKRGNPQAALQHFQTSLSIRPTALAGHSIGMIQLGEGRIAEAEEAFRIAVDLDRTNENMSFENLATTLIAQNRFDEARDLLTQALSRDDSSFIAHNGLGVIYIHGQQFPEAAAHLQRATELEPKNWETRANYGRALLEVGRFNDAIKELNAVKRPERVYIRINLARALAGVGRLEESRTELREVIEVAPQLELARDLLKQLEASMRVPSP